jgi:predicted chitinase
MATLEHSVWRSYRGMEGMAGIWCYSRMHILRLADDGDDKMMTRSISNRKQTGMANRASILKEETGGRECKRVYRPMIL